VRCAGEREHGNEIDYRERAEGRRRATHLDLYCNRLDCSDHDVLVPMYTDSENPLNNRGSVAVSMISHQHRWLVHPTMFSGVQDLEDRLAIRLQGTSAMSFFPTLFVFSIAVMINKLKRGRKNVTMW
jgi:hypothetical protein